MSIVIKEYVDSKFHHSISSNDFDLTEAEKKVSCDVIQKDSLMVEIEGIHAYPHATRNFTRYLPKALKNSVKSWTEPYRKPLIKHHNETDGEIIGRIISAEYKTKDTLSGTPALVFTVNVPGDAKEDVANGLLTTTSIGVSANDVTCSICGHQLADGSECGHERGHVYDGEICYWDINQFTAKELSYVIVPSDVFSKNIGMYSYQDEKSKKMQVKESFNENNKGENKLMSQAEEKVVDTAKNMAEAKKDDLAETKELLEKVQKELAELKEAQEALLEAKKEKTAPEAPEEEKKTAEEPKEKEVKENQKEVVDIEKLKAGLKEEQQLRECLEAQLAEAKASERKYKVETLQLLRRSAGKKEFTEDAITSRSDESIMDSIMDLKEELKVIESKKEKKLPVGKVEDPTLKDMEESKKEIKIEKEINLKESLCNIMSDMFVVHK